MTGGWFLRLFLVFAIFGDHQAGHDWYIVGSDLIEKEREKEKEKKRERERERAKERERKRGEGEVVPLLGTYVFITSGTRAQAPTIAS